MVSLPVSVRVGCVGLFRFFLNTKPVNAPTPIIKTVWMAMYPFLFLDPFLCFLRYDKLFLGRKRLAKPLECQRVDFCDGRGLCFLGCRKGDGWPYNRPRLVDINRVHELWGLCVNRRIVSLHNIRHQAYRNHRQYVRNHRPPPFSFVSACPVSGRAGVASTSFNRIIRALRSCRCTDFNPARRAGFLFASVLIPYLFLSVVTIPDIDLCALVAEGNLAYILAPCRIRITADPTPAKQ